MQMYNLFTPTQTFLKKKHILNAMFYSKNKTRILKVLIIKYI